MVKDEMLILCVYLLHETFLTRIYKESPESVYLCGFASILKTRMKTEQLNEQLNEQISIVL